MRVLYLGYWGSKDSLTASTILPSLRVLGAFPQITQIIYCSIERSGEGGIIALPKVEHVAIPSRDMGSVVLTKVRDYRVIYATLRRLCEKYAIDLMICRSSLAGAFGHRIKRKLGTPYIVESFEPHRDYMVESGVWSRYDLRSFIQSLHEGQQKESADFILPVSSNYVTKLIGEGIDRDKISLLPCCVDLQKFSFDTIVRNAMRDLHSYHDRDVVGIYVGKFGGIYYDREAFRIFREAFDYFGVRFQLILLSSDEHDGIRMRASQHTIPLERVVIRSVPHDEVNSWLCAADFAFCTVRPAPSRKFCSPVKNGEYWACGLPVVIEPGIGDDSDIIAGEGGGVVVREGNYSAAFRKVEQLLAQGRSQLAEVIRSIAVQHRDPRRIVDIYREMLNRLLARR